MLELGMNAARSEPTPRLHYGDGEWTLEIHELVAVDRDIYRPAARRVRGMEAIVSHLKRSGADPAFRDATIVLMKTRRDEDAWYEFIDGEWISAALASKLRPQEPLERDLDSTLKELRAELLVLHASHRTLKERVLRAETRLHEEFPEPDVSADVGDESPPPPEEPAAVAMAPVEPAAVEPAPPASPAPEADEADEPEEARVTLPARTAILAALKQLLGRDPGLDYTSERPPSADALSEYRASLLVDQTGRELGTLLVNARAIAELGGGLLGLPEPEIERLAESGAPTEDSIAAMNEYCNNLAAAVNRASTGVQVVAEPLEVARPARLGWLPSSSKSCVLSNKAGAELWLVAR